MYEVVSKRGSPVPGSVGPRSRRYSLEPAEEGLGLWVEVVLLAPEAEGEIFEAAVTVPVCPALLPPGPDVKEPPAPF